MASPFAPTKKTVDLAARPVAGSRIRRDPPPPAAKPVSAQDIRERERRDAVIGVVIFALALMAVLIGFEVVAGWYADPNARYVVRM